MKAPVTVSDHLVTLTKHLRLDLAAHTKVHDTVHEKNLLISSKLGSSASFDGNLDEFHLKKKIKLKITLFFFLDYSWLNTLLLSSNQFPH